MTPRKKRVQPEQLALAMQKIQHLTNGTPFLVTGEMDDAAQSMNEQMWAHYGEIYIIEYFAEL